MNTAELLQRASYVGARRKHWEQRVGILRERQERLAVQEMQLTRQGKFLEETKLLLQKAVDLIYEESLKEVTSLLNKALEYIFYDRALSVKLELEAARGKKTLDIVIVDSSGEEPLEVSIKDGCGFGVRTVVSAILHTYYLLARKQLPILFVDEGYAYISDQYMDRFFQFIEQLARERGFCLVLISHDERFAAVANKTYVIDSGRVKE